MLLLVLFHWSTRKKSTSELSFPSDPVCGRDKASRVAAALRSPRPLPTQRTKQLLIQVPRPLATRLFALAGPGLSFVRSQPCHLPRRHARGCSIIRSSPPAFSWRHTDVSRRSQAGAIWIKPARRKRKPKTNRDLTKLRKRIQAHSQPYSNAGHRCPIRLAAAAFRPLLFFLRPEALARQEECPKMHACGVK